MLYRHYFAILEQSSEVLKVCCGSLVIIRYGGVVLEEEPKRLVIIPGQPNYSSAERRNKLTLPSAVYDSIHSFARTPGGREPLIMPGGKVRMTLLSPLVSSTVVFLPGIIH